MQLLNICYFSGIEIDVDEKSVYANNNNLNLVFYEFKMIILALLPKRTTGSTKFNARHIIDSELMFIKYKIHP